MGGDGGSWLGWLIGFFFKGLIRGAILVVALVGFAAILLPTKAKAAEIGIHTVSIHAPEKPYYNNANFGLYSLFDNGVIVGGYKNTYSNPSFYVAKLWEHETKFGVALGLVSGYQRKTMEVDPVAPNDCGDGNPPPCTANAGRTRGAIGLMFMFSYALPKIGPVQPRIWFLPPITKDSSTIVHLTVGF
jgi:hypothetical protein